MDDLFFVAILRVGQQRRLVAQAKDYGTLQARKLTYSARTVPGVVRHACLAWYNVSRWAANCHTKGYLTVRPKIGNGIDKSLDVL